MYPFFSVVTVAFQNLSGLRRTFESTKMQDFGSFEHIIIDGGSHDGTLEFLESIDSPAVTVISEKDNGIYDAMNKGLKLARGSYVIFMNSGDVFHEENVLRKVYDAVSNERSYPAVVYGGACENHGAELVVKPARNLSKISYGMVAHHQAMFFNAQSLEGEIYDTEYSIAADYDLFCRVVRKDDHCLKLDFVICDFEVAGLSGEKYIAGAVEAFSIKKRVLGLSFPARMFFLVVSVSANIARRNFPRIYGWIRYAR
ncbi:glycosyltransferase family 2 protein [Halomonas salinarum]|uniref:glycosyltransferase family 2 protein n=1 Tax=Halomonas salinarum TaxID=1158993 RepID=UPI00143B83D0|nr:glycosyltransferase family 2 protein [Halomonas salinarum]